MTDAQQSQLAGTGATHVAVGDRDGKVILQFPEPVQWIALEPGTAVGVAKSVIDAAVACGANVTIQAPRPQVPAAIRQRMEARALMILRNKREAPEKDPVLAARMVDTLLNMLDL